MDFGLFGAPEFEHLHHDTNLPTALIRKVQSMSTEKTNEVIKKQCKINPIVKSVCLCVHVCNGEKKKSDCHDKHKEIFNNK